MPTKAGNAIAAGDAHTQADRARGGDSPPMRASAVGAAARATILVIGVAAMTGLGVLIGVGRDLDAHTAVLWAIPFGVLIGALLSMLLVVRPATRAARDRRRMIERIEAIATAEREASFETLLAVDARHELADLAKTVHGALTGAHTHRLEAARLRREMNALVEHEARKHVAHLTTLSMTDELTGLANRRGFEQGLNALVARAQSDGTEVALLAIDLDNFKRLNDTCGHHKGDEALSVAGDLLQAHVRERDLAGRMGGDELFIALSGVDGRRAEAVADRLIRLFASHPMAHQPSVPWPTMSVGIALLREDGCRDASELRLYADQALYTSKRRGRARASRYGAVA